MRELKDMRLGFIGAGSMAEAMMRGMAASGVKLCVHDKAAEKAQALASSCGAALRASNRAVVEASEVVILAVKPNVYAAVLSEIAPSVSGDHLIVSIAPGITRERVRSFLPSHPKILRMMPNTPALVGEGMLALSPDPDIEPELMDALIRLLSSIGIPDFIDESLLNAVTGLSGSGPAYAFLFIEALADGAVLRGMPRDKAYLYASQTLLGAAKMVRDTRQHPGVLKDAVCSPGGTTIEAVRALERSGFRAAIIDAVAAAGEKAASLAQQ